MAKIQTEVGAIDLETFGIAPVTIPDAAYTLKADDAGRRLLFTNAGAVTVTVPNEATFKWRAVSCTLVQMGAGKVSLSAGNGVTLNGPGGLLGTSAQYAEIKITKQAANVYVLGGSLG